MAHIYSAKGKRIRLQASGAAGLRFRTPGHAVRAARDLRAAAGPAGRRFHHFLLLEPGATLPARHARHVLRSVPVLVEPDSGLRLLATEEITLRLKAKVTARQRDKLLRSLGLTVVTRNEFHPRQFLVALQSGADEARTLDLANKLAADELVEFATPNFVCEHRKLAEPNDPLFPSQWHLHNTGRGGGRAGEDVGAPAAWAISTGSPSVVIAIIDDGVDLGHPDLRANIWVNPDSQAPDRHGRNFYDNNFDPRPRYFQAPFNNPESNDIHGTACAGVAAARGDNRHGCAGIAYDSRILAVKIFGSDNMASNSRVADAIRYAGRRSQVISCSWSSAPNPDLESAIDEVVKTGRGGKGCLVFISTGNTGQPKIGFPSNLPHVLAVGASNDQGVLAQYSSFGKGIECVTPSSDPIRKRQGITTTDVARRNRGFDLRSAYTHIFGGTSSSTPLAAGIAALVLSVNPSLTWREVRAILRSTADKIDPRGGRYKNGYSLKYGFGRLNAGRAVAAARAARG